MRVFLTALLILVAGPVHAETRTAPISDTALVARLTATLDSLTQQDRFSGVVVLARRGSSVYQRACGIANRDSSRANNPETVFGIGSIGKAFTATAVRQLAAAGKLELDSTVARYWPDCPNREIAHRVTIRQLIEHRSGVGGNIFGPNMDRRAFRHNRDLLPLFIHEPLQFEPGSQRQYSNAGYVLLGIIIERASGEDYYEYVRRHIFEPAGMHHTGYFSIDSLPPNTATGYTHGPLDGPRTGPLRPNSDLAMGRGSAAGGAYSTAADLLAFLADSRAGRIVGGPPSDLAAAGGAAGGNSTLEGDLPGGLDLVVLANLDPPAAEEVAARVRRWLGLDY